MTVKTEEKNNFKNENKFIRCIHDIFEFVELIAVCLAIILFVYTFFFKHSVVVGDSMNKTLLSGDHLLTSNFMYTPENGDIIVCQVTDAQQESYPRTLTQKEAIVKRVIAIAGQRIKIESGTVYIDGKAIEENYTFNQSFENMDELLVPDGCVFVMGDNRSNSLDSRYIGVIDERLILGKVILRIAPFSSFGNVYN